MSTSDIIALIALVLTGLSFSYTISVDIRNRRNTKNQDALNVKLLAKEVEEERKRVQAEVNATLYKRGKNDWVLKIYNKGDSVAKNVDWKCISEEPGWMFHRNPFPLEFLNPMQSVDIQVVVFMGNQDKMKIQVTWDDEESKSKSWESILII